MVIGRMSIYRTPRWRLLRRSVLDAANWTCSTCGRYGNEVDHVVPMAKGGPVWDRKNLSCQCAGCHSVKTAKENRTRPLPRDEKDWRDYLHHG